MIKTSCLALLLLPLSFFGQSTKEEYNERAINHMYAKEYEQAIVNFTKVIELNPNDSLAYFDRGMAKEFNNDFLGAIEDYSLQLKVDPNMVDCYFLRGILEHRLGNNKKAEADFLKTIELEEDNADAHYFLGQIYFAKRKNKRALQHMNQAIIFNPEVGDYYDLRSKIEEKLKMKKEAEDDLLLRNELYKQLK
jgi:tetratricopeptide (TPR) repeat protein